MTSYSKNPRKNVAVQKNFENKGIHGLSIKILKNSNRPLSVQEITERLQKFRRVRGKTPQNTVSYSLQTSKHAKRVSWGVYKYKP